MTDNNKHNYSEQYSIEDEFELDEILKCTQQ